MTLNHNGKLNRRDFLKQFSVAGAGFAAGLGVRPVYAAGKRRTSAGARRKVIVLGIDGMDPRLCERLMNAGRLPNFDKLRKLGGYKPLGTSIPPQSPVAWANFINGAGPGSHGIFDFIHRDPAKQAEIVDSISEIKPGSGFGVGNRVLLLTRSPKPVLKRQGVPFWDYLDNVGISSDVYLVPSNYPPSRSKHRRHRSLSGLGTPDLRGTLGTYQYFTEDGPAKPKEEKNGRHCRVVFKNGTSEGELLSPPGRFLRNKTIKFAIHRDLEANAAVIEIQGRKVLLKEGQWSDWTELNFVLDMPNLMPDRKVSGICRIYLKQVAPVFRLYISPMNVNPASPALRISEPDGFSAEVSKELGLFYTVGFQEDFKARTNNVFTDEEYAAQAEMVLQTRLKLLKYAFEHYEDGLLFFYFSSTDLQSHIFWWDTYDKYQEHPWRSQYQAMKFNNQIKDLYKRMDSVVGEALERYGDEATILVLSDHGFANSTRRFNLNTWLRANGYILPSYCTTLYPDKDKEVTISDSGETVVDWSKTRAYGLGTNGLYLNLKGRERQGIVMPEQREGLLQELITKLEGQRDVDGRPIFRKVYRSDKVYSGPAMKYSPDLILGFYRGYMTDGGTRRGLLTKEVFSDNTGTWAWNADHCFDPREVPGVLFSNKPIGVTEPALIDLAPTILEEFGLKTPSSMTGKNVFAT